MNSSTLSTNPSNSAPHPEGPPKIVLRDISRKLEMHHTLKVEKCTIPLIILPVNQEAKPHDIVEKSESHTAFDGTILEKSKRLYKRILNE